MSSSKPIRAILGRFTYDISHQTMEKVFQTCPFDFCGIIAAGDEPRYYSGIPQSQQEWFCSSTIRGCQYDNADWNSIAPLDEELIERMSECEMLFMNTVCRLEWKYEISYNVRKHWYLRHLRFWNDYIDRNRINLYLSAWIPHEIPDVIIYHLCKLKDIPVLYFHTSSVRDASFTEYDFREPAFRIRKRYEELLSEYADVEDPEKIPLTDRFDDRYNALTGAAGQKPPVEGVSRPLYWDHVRRLFRRRPMQFFRYGLRFFTPSGIRRALQALKRRRIVKKYRAFYDSNAVEPDLTRPYVYLALHFQPEASTTPMGGAFADQVLIAQLLSAHLPDDVLIYVKEHPREGGWLTRSIEYYQNFLVIPNVRLVKRSTKTFDLRENCVAVATITGTVGFEALFRGKPVFLFGHRFFQYARGVFPIHSEQDCADAVQSVFEKGVAPTLVESRLYLKAMEDTCIKGTLNIWHQKVTNLPDQENVEANRKAILEELAHLDAEIAAVS